MTRPVAWACLLAVLLAPIGSRAQPASEDSAKHGLSQVEQDLASSQQRRDELDRRAAAQAQELAQLRQKLVLAGQQTRQNEAALSGFEERLAALESEAAAKRASLGTKRERLAGLLVALQRLSLEPPEALLALPRPPVDTVRGAIIMGGTVPAIAAETASLKAELVTLSDADAAVRRQRDLVADASGKLSIDRRDLDALIARKAVLEQRTEAERHSESERLTKLAGTAQNLRELIARLEAQRQAEERARAAAEQRARAEPIASRSANSLGQVVPSGRGLRSVPAAGKLMSSYGQTDEYGAIARGLTIETRPDAVVVAPDGGRVLFAGPFRGYGQILIIEHGGGYHSLLAGLGRIDAAVGRAVEAGEPVGTMGHDPDHNPSLYFELRRSGQPTNPQPWLIAQGGK